MHACNEQTAGYNSQGGILAGLSNSVLPGIEGLNTGSSKVHTLQVYSLIYIVSADGSCKADVAIIAQALL
jgi:hypothetical protein